jgi:peptidoglycan hydrolase-like protein with peptidoglycan-binding domain
MKRTTLFIALASAFSLSAFAAGEEQHSGAQSGQGAQGSTQQSASQQQKQSPEVVKQVQQKLSENGQDVQPDGKMGPKTQAALKEFQQQNGIKPTGQLDQQTLAALKIGESGSSATGGSASPSKGGGASGSGAGSDDTSSKSPSSGAKQ